jgi:hypothetical protein
MLVDQTKDPGYAYLRVIVDKFPAVREMCKTASMEPEAFASLPKEAFAWPEKRMFPVNNREQTALSLGYVKVASGVPEHVQRLVEDAADLYDIPADAYAPAQTKVASEPTYLLPERQRFAVHSAADVKAVETAYHYKYAQLSVEDRIQAGYNLTKVAEQFGVDLEPSTQKLAGFTMTNTAALRDCLRARAVAAEKVASPMSEVFTKMAEAFNGVQPLLDDHAEQLQLAMLIDGLDKQAGITHFYGKKLYDPMKSVFNTEKFASAFMKTAGALQNKALLQQLPLDFWKDALGDDIAKEIAPNGQVDVTTLEQILPTLPADMKATLERQLAAYSK